MPDFGSRVRVHVESKISQQAVYRFRMANFIPKANTRHLNATGGFWGGESGENIYPLSGREIPERRSKTRRLPVHVCG
jgi:hypothetical protein